MTLSQLPPGGIPAVVVAQSFGLKNGRAFSPTIMKIRSYVKRLGRNPDELFWKEGDQRDAKWFSKPDAIRAVLGAQAAR